MSSSSRIGNGHLSLWPKPFDPDMPYHKPFPHSYKSTVWILQNKQTDLLSKNIISYEIQSNCWGWEHIITTTYEVKGEK